MTEKYSYHQAHFVLIGKYECWAMQTLALEPGDAKTKIDYSEKLNFEITQEIMSQHVGGSWGISMEVSSVKTFRAGNIKVYQECLL